MHLFIFFSVLLLGTSVFADGDNIDDSSNFVFGKRKSLMIVTTQAPNTTSITINPRIAAWNARVRNDSGNVTKSSGSSAGLKPRALFETPFNGESGGSTSLETNFLSIQSGNTKLTNGGRSFPQGFVPIGAPIIGVGSPQITINNDPSCRCEAYADCRDVSAFARADKQQRGGACPPGRVFCCANARPSAPVLVQPPNQPIPIIIPSPNPGVVVQPVPLPPNGLNIPNPAFQGCGIKGGNPLARTFDVTNPQGETEFGEYPWMTAILKTDLSYVCGGALIDARVVLTAAHCVAKVRNEDLIVRLGEYDVSETSEPAYQDIHVRRVVIHIDYHSGTLRNDIALLILDQPVIMTGYIRPVCLPPAIDFTGLTCTVTGWGKNNPGGQFSNKLKEVDVPVMDNERCQNTLRTAPELGPVFNLHNSFLCAGMPGKDACSGDGGSPLVCKVDGVYRLAGLVSWGINCGQFPGVYTRVANYLPWIMNVLQDSA